MSDQIHLTSPAQSLALTHGSNRPPAPKKRKFHPSLPYPLLNPLLADHSSSLSPPRAATPSPPPPLRHHSSPPLPRRHYLRCATTPCPHSLRRAPSTTCPWHPAPCPQLNAATRPRRKRQRRRSPDPPIQHATAPSVAGSGHPATTPPTWLHPPHPGATPPCSPRHGPAAAFRGSTQGATSAAKDVGRQASSHQSPTSSCDNN